MICKDCKAQKHELCPSGTWCDCAHRPTQVIQEADTTPFPTSVLDAIDRALEDTSTWVRRERPQRHHASSPDRLCVCGKVHGQEPVS